MKLKDLEETFDLHDSGIDAIHYVPYKRMLILDVTLCNWRQSSYRENDPELVEGHFTFLNVAKVDVNFTGEKHAILASNVLMRDNDSTILTADFLEKEEALQIALNGDDSEDITILTIVAQEVTWKEISPQPESNG